MMIEIDQWERLKDLVDESLASELYLEGYCPACGEYVQDVANCGCDESAKEN